MRHTALYFHLSAAGAGLLIGSLDFLCRESFPALLFTALGGVLLGWLAPRLRFRLAVGLGVCVPLAVIMGMALRQHPARPHFVFLDARAVPIALIGASIGAWLHTQSSP